MWYLMRNSNLSSELGYHVKRNREIAKTYRKTRVNSKKSWESVYNLIRKIHISILKILRAQSTCNLLSFLTIWANLKMVSLSNEFLNKTCVFAVFRLFFVIKANSANGIRFSGKFYIENIFLGIFLNQIWLFVLKVSKNDDKNFFSQIPRKKNFKFHIGRQFWIFWAHI